MSALSRVRLFGGPEDGRVHEVDDAILRTGTLNLPITPRVSVLDYPPSDVLAPTLKCCTYRWDGTRNDAGEARFRWTP